MEGALASIHRQVDPFLIKMCAHLIQPMRHRRNLELVSKVLDSLIGDVLCHGVVRTQGTCQAVDETETSEGEPAVGMTDAATPCRGYERARRTVSTPR